MRQPNASILLAVLLVPGLSTTRSEVCPFEASEQPSEAPIAWFGVEGDVLESVYKYDQGSPERVIPTVHVDVGPIGLIILSRYQDRQWRHLFRIFQDHFYIIR